jgi:hypothetical protein
MAAALIQVCTDFRLNHELIRMQVRQRLERSGLSAQRIYVLNEVGGNPGQNFTHTLQLLSRVGEPIVFCAVLHHDDCLAAQQGLRLDLASAVNQMEAELGRIRVRCPVLTGEIRTQHNQVRWLDEPEVRYQPFTFGSGWH